MNIIINFGIHYFLSDLVLKQIMPLKIGESYLDYAALYVIDVIYDAVYWLSLLAQYSAGNPFLCNAEVDAGKWPSTHIFYNW